VGLALEVGYIKVDGTGRCVRHLRHRRHHAGDARHPQLAHVSSAEGIIVADECRPGRHPSYDHVPGCTYCDPKSAAWV
jgi:pyruvate/2-oxoglutarate dehydrogenase complex dihydrolipoamide dehydrogenase (E3) component